jgi:hypothetical protein
MPDKYHSKANLLKAMNRGAPISLIREERKEAKMTPAQMKKHESKESAAHERLERKFGLK